MSNMVPLSIPGANAGSNSIAGTTDGSSTPHWTGSPETGPLDCHISIPEEYEDETSSEAVEPLTPTSETHSHDFHHHKPGALEPHGDPVPADVHPAKLSPVPTNATVTSPAKTPSTPARSAPTHVAPIATSGLSVPNSASRKTSARIKSLFRRSTAHTFSGFHAESKATPTPAATFPLDVTVPDVGSSNLPPQPRRTSSFSLSAWSSARTSKSNTPPSPGSPNMTVTQSSTAADGNALKPSSSATGLSSEGAGRIKFQTHMTPPGPDRERQRSTSMTSLPLTIPDNSISLHAATGAGLKARRMSTSLPDDFFVEAVELHTEFVSSSIVPGRRGRLIGSGATANVKLMARRGGPTDVLYAVKEFRKKGRHESEEEYEKKLKSEFCIARSLHHPNVVETVRLCTHNGRWNHVMEYCSQGELFSLVQRRYMDESDRLCFFKQLLRGVVHLHSHGIAHRDLKLENLLVTNTGTLKITDFGVSEVFCGEHPGLRGAGGECGRNMKESRRCAPGICGSLPYIAPEVLEKKGEYDPRPLDVWSCAIVYLTMKFGGSPWPAAERRYAQYDKFARGWEAFNAKHPDQVITDETGTPKCGEIFGFLESQAMRRLLLRMLNPNPTKRIGIREGLNDRWVKTIECCSEDGDSATVGLVDVAEKKCRLKAAGIKKLHNHLPPARRLEALHPTF